MLFLYGPRAQGGGMAEKAMPRLWSVGLAMMRTQDRSELLELDDTWSLDGPRIQGDGVAGWLVMPR